MNIPSGYRETFACNKEKRRLVVIIVVGNDSFSVYFVICVTMVNSYFSKIVLKCSVCSWYSSLTDTVSN